MWTRSVPVGEIRLLGDGALIVGVEDAAAARRLVVALDEGVPPGVTWGEVVGGLATVVVNLVPDGEDSDARRERLAELVASLARGAGAAAADDTDRDIRPLVVSIPTVFDGPDLAEVAALARCTASSVIERLTARVLTVEVVGFSPGFAYLAGLPEELAEVPRRASPRPVVPTGSVAVAGGYAAVYPGASPGGWQLLGRTSEPLFSSREPPYARLAPGDRVQFTVSSETDPTPPPAAVAATEPPLATAHPVFVVEEAGLRTVLQDGGRRGMAAIGVPGAGPADPYSFEVANRLVGNEPDAAALEITARGPTMRCLRPAYVAIVGPGLDVRVAGQPVPSGRVLPLTEGQQLSVGAVRGGLRAYLAVAGGFDGPLVLGSRSSDQLAGLGPGPLAHGDLLGTGTLRPPLGDHVRPDAVAQLAPGQPVVLRVVPGPHHEWFAPDDYATLADRRFRVGADSNRVGLRLEQVEGPPPLRPAHGGPGELDSQGTVTGTVQVPPRGDPVILLPDHATLGGYPVLAVVASADHGWLGQCAPGASVVLVPVDHRAARAALAERRRALAGAVSGLYPLAVE
ncbi:MAG TPA: carboxyltransferase domain-containing protein [Acidimicrobiales bacterium]